MDEIEYRDVTKELLDKVKDAYHFEETSKPCEYCISNPKNGGSGICCCTIGLPQITC